MPVNHMCANSIIIIAPPTVHECNSSQWQKNVGKEQRGWVIFGVVDFQI